MSAKYSLASILLLCFCNIIAYLDCIPHMLHLKRHPSDQVPLLNLRRDLPSEVERRGNSDAVSLQEKKENVIRYSRSKFIF